MPLMRTHHEIHALPHLGFHQNGNGFLIARKGLRQLERLDATLHVIAIHLQHHPLECLEFGAEITKAHDGICTAVNLLFIIVDRNNQIVNVL